MRVSNVEDVGGTALSFILSGFQATPITVTYNRVIQKVLCINCNRTTCEHVQFMKSAIDEYETWMISDFIDDCCDVRMTFDEHKEMKKAFDQALIGIEQKQDTPAPPKPPPSPFSLIEVDDVY